MYEGDHLESGKGEIANRIRRVVDDFSLPRSHHSTSRPQEQETNSLHGDQEVTGGSERRESPSRQGNASERPDTFLTRVTPSRAQCTDHVVLQSPHQTSDDGHGEIAKVRPLLQWCQ